MQVRFAVISDTHFDIRLAQDRSWWNKLLHSRQDDMAVSLVSTIQALSPEFIIHCGDVTNQGDRASFLRAKHVFEQFPCPYFFVLGNHDTFVQGTREFLPEIFTLTQKSSSRIEYIAGLRFIFFDTVYRTTPDGSVYDHSPDVASNLGPRIEDLVWLGKELQQDTQTLTFFVAHTPLFAKIRYPIGSMPVCELVDDTPPPRPLLTEPVDITPAWFPTHKQELLRILRESSNLIATLTGHWHIQDVTFDNDILHCQTGALVEYPFSIRLITLNDRHLSIETVPLDDPSLNTASIVSQWRNLWVEGTHQDKQHRMELGS